jgi:hypothetical protein
MLLNFLEYCEHTSIYLISFISPVNFQFFRKVRERDELFKTTDLSTLLHIWIVSNSHLLGFYSSGIVEFQQGSAQNWNSTGYFELYSSVSKYSVKCLTTSDVVSPGQRNN